MALLAIDVGNTQTGFGLFEGAELREHWRVATERNRSGDELGALFGNFLDLSAVEGVAVASTVPQLHRAYEDLAKEYVKAELLELGPGVKTGVPIRYDDPREVGPDRIANAVAAVERYGAPAIVVDFGTSTNFDVVSPAGEYVGGVLAPEIEIGRSSRTSSSASGSSATRRSSTSAAPGAAASSRSSTSSSVSSCTSSALNGRGKRPRPRYQP